MFQEMALYLPQPVFTRGQFYEAVSRCNAAGNMKIIIGVGKFAELDGFYTDNIVYSTGASFKNSCLEACMFLRIFAIQAVAYSPTLAYPMPPPPVFGPVVQTIYRAPLTTLNLHRYSTIGQWGNWLFATNG